MNKFDKIDAEVNILLLKPNEESVYKLNKSQDWLEGLLNELNDKVSERTTEQYLADSEINLDITLKRVHHQPFGNVLICRGHLEVSFFTECVRTLKEMKDEISIDFKACFIPNHFAEDEEYEDLDETFVDNDVHEVHFSENNIANLKEMTHELIYLNINQYPVIDEDGPIETMDSPTGLKQ